MTDFSSFKKLSIGGVALKQLFVDGIQVFKSGYTNQVPLSIDTNGSIYNGTGYKDGYRVRSGGAEAAETSSRITGYIPVASGDTVRFAGWNFAFPSVSNAVNFSDGEFVNLGQFTTQPAGYGICLDAIPAISTDNNVFKFTVPGNANVRYIRVTAQHAAEILPPDMIVTVNEEI